MIRVTVEMVPEGNEDRKTEIGRILLSNDMTHEAHPVMGNYTIKAIIVAPNGDTHMSARYIRDFERLRWNAWGLLYLALKSLGYDGMEGGNDDNAVTS